MSDLARPFRVGTYDITTEQVSAVVDAVRAQRGSFNKSFICGAFFDQGVPSLDPKQSWACQFVADRAGDRMLQRMRKAGLIRAIDNKTWELVPPTTENQ